MLYTAPLGKVLCLIFITLILSNCAVNKTKDSEKNKLPIWPSPPAEARFKYIMTIRESLDIVKIPDKELRTLLTGSVGMKAMEIESAYGVAARQGLILVTDRRKNLVHAFDIPKRKYYAFGFRREGRLGNPLGIALDNKFNVYVADRNRIVVYDKLGLYKHLIGNDYSFINLTSVSVSDDGKMIVAVDTGGIDSEKHRFVVFDGQGKKLFEVGKRGKKNAEFNLPLASAIGPDGTIYILDAGNFRVQAFSRKGEFLLSFGSLGNSFGQFSRPKGITTDSAGNIYVSDAGFSNVQVFNSKGKFLLPIGTKSSLDRPGNYRLPIGIAVDKKNYLYIVDALFNKMDVIQKLTLE